MGNEERGKIKSGNKILLNPFLALWVSQLSITCFALFFFFHFTVPSLFPELLPWARFRSIFRFRLEGIIPLFSLYPKGYQSIEVWLKLLSQGTGQNLRSQLKDFTDPFIHKESFKISPLFIHNFDPATHLNFRQLRWFCVNRTPKRANFKPIENLFGAVWTLPQVP